MYLDKLGLTFVSQQSLLILIYTVGIAGMMVSAIPTFSGKLTGERVARDYVLPVFVISVLAVILLATYPYKTLSIVSAGYLALIPYSIYRFSLRLKKDAEAGEPVEDAPIENAPIEDAPKE